MRSMRLIESSDICLISIKNGHYHVMPNVIMKNEN